MSTTAPAQLDPSSLDLAGISVATAAPSDNPRTGTAYDPVVCAAAAPIWFHPLPGGSHLMVCARRWSAAIPGGGGGGYSSYTESLEPSWFLLNGRTGARTFVPGWGPTIPINTKIDSPRLQAAASRAPDYLYLLHSGVIAGQPGALIQHLRVAPAGTRIYVEETLPTAPAGSEVIVFDQGLQYVTPYLFAYGTDAAGVLYQIRKPWSLIGTSARQASGYTPAWEYFTGTGYSTDPAQLTPLELTTAGPLGFGVFRTTALMSTCVLSGTDYLGRVWESRQGRPFRPTATSVNLGSGGSHLGHGLALQPMLEPNPAAEAMAGASAGVPYLSTQKLTTAGGDALVNAWGMHTIRV
jgi:hypothetical protein